MVWIISSAGHSLPYTRVLRRDVGLPLLYSYQLYIRWQDVQRRSQCDCSLIIEDRGIPQQLNLTVWPVPQIVFLYNHALCCKPKESSNSKWDWDQCDLFTSTRIYWISFQRGSCIIAQSQQFINELDPNPAWVVKWMSSADVDAGLSLSLPSKMDRKMILFFDIIIIPKLSVPFLGPCKP